MSLEKSLKRSKLQKDKAKKRNMPIAMFLAQNECCVVNCGSRSHNNQGQSIQSGLTFFTFPIWRKNNGLFISDLSKRQRQAWVEAVGRDDITFDNVPDEARVCSRHFISGNPAYEMKEQDPDWAPSLHLNNKQNHVDRNPSTIRGNSIENKPNPKAADSETPRVLQWKNLESGLQRLMRDKQQPTETPPLLNDNVSDFKDFFQNALKASLDACLDSSSQSTSESGFFVDPSWFPPRQKSVVGQFSQQDSPVSVASCENCVRLQEKISELEERLSTPLFLRDNAASSKWNRPLSQTELGPGTQPQTEQDEQPSSSPEPRFQHEWLKEYWFLRYSPKLKLMWCQVCRLYAAHRSSAFVKGTRTFSIQSIINHNWASYHKESVRKFKARKEDLKNKQTINSTVAQSSFYTGPE